MVLILKASKREVPVPLDFKLTQDGNTVTGLRHDSDLEVREGMCFHLLSWFTETGRGDFFVSNCALLGPGGPELLTQAPMGPTVV